MPAIRRPKPSAPDKTPVPKRARSARIRLKPAPRHPEERKMGTVALVHKAEAIASALVALSPAEPEVKKPSARGKSPRMPVTTEAAMKTFISLVERAAYHQSRRDVFRDFVTSARIAFEQAANKMAGRFDQAIEDEYLRIAKKHGEQFRLFPQMLGALVDGLGEPNDFLGKAYMDIEVSLKHSGQFFTPWSVAAMLAAMQLPGDRAAMQKLLKSCAGGVVTIHEPAAGSGVMVMAFAEILRSHGVNPATSMHATLIDVDRLCVDMAYVQLTLLGIPADVIHGNALSLETWWSRSNVHARALYASNPAFRNRFAGPPARPAQVAKTPSPPRKKARAS